MQETLVSWRSFFSPAAHFRAYKRAGVEGGGKSEENGGRHISLRRCGEEGSE